MTEVSQSAVGRLLDRDVPEDYLDERTQIVSAEKRTEESGIKSVVIFRIGLEWLALSTSIFQEVTEPGRIHKIPHRTGILSGLVNVRGELVLCVAIEVLLGLEPVPDRNESREQTAGRRLLVCNRGGNTVAFFVSEVHGVYQYHPRDLKDIPATLAKSAASYTAGILHWKERTVGYLDDELLFYALNKGLS